MDKGKSYLICLVSITTNFNLLISFTVCAPLFVDTEKEDAILHMLGEINRSLQASSKSVEPLQVPQGTSLEKIFEALRGIPRLTLANLLRAYSVLIWMIAGSDLLWHSPKP